MIKITYYFVAETVLILVFEHIGILIIKLEGVAALYAAASLLASASSLVVFLLIGFFYSYGLRGAKRFFADFLLTIIASIIPLLIMEISTLAFSARMSLKSPILSSLLEAASYNIPAIWVGWSVITLAGAKRSESWEENEPRSDPDHPGWTKYTDPEQTKTTSFEEQMGITQVTQIQSDAWPRWMRKLDYARLLIEEQNYEAARPLFGDVISTLLTSQQAVEPQLLLSVSAEYADCLCQLREYELAKEHYERAIILQYRIPSDGRKFAWLLAKLSTCHQKSNQTLE